MENPENNRVQKFTSNGVFITSKMQAVVMKTSTYLTVIFILALGWSSNGHAQPEREVHLDVGEEGIYRASFMYWSNLTLFWQDFNEMLIVHGEVNEVRPESSLPIAGTSVGGQIQVESVLRCPPSSLAAANRINVLDCEGGFDNLEVGDEVVFFLVQYEGSFAAAPYAGTNCVLGVRLPRSHEIALFKPEELLDLIATVSEWNTDVLTTPQISIWAWISPRAVVADFIRRREDREDQK